MESVGSGLTAFLMSDVVGSTAAWEADPEGMAASIVHHDEIIDRLSHANDGKLVKSRGEGDSHFIVFPNVRDAVSCAKEIHRALAVTRWPGPALQVRIAVHLGEAVTRSGDYYGPTVNRCARIRALAQAGQLLISDAVFRILSENPPKDLRFVDLGPHRLKDLLRPERLWHVEVESSSRSFAPLRSFSNTPNNLPVQLTEFIGRKADVEETQNLVRRHRLVTLLGAGGSGKTRLAMQVAAEMADDFSDGVWWVDLSAVQPGDDTLPSVIGKALDIPPTSEVSPIDNVLSWIESKHALIILDNCEQISQQVAALAGRLMTQSPSVHLLSTSRHTLNASGEQVHAIPTLSFPARDTKITVENCLSYEAIELLVERAKMRDARFAPTDGNAKDLAEICRRLDGLPLAIELAAPKLTFLGPSAMVKRLDDIFRLLHGGSSQALPRHQTIETAIEWSYGLLTPEEQTLFRRLSIFASPWSLEQAEEICGFEPLESHDAVEFLMGLRDKSLITAVHADSGERFLLLEPIRQFAERKLGAEDEKAATEDHLIRWYAFTAKMAEESNQSASWTEAVASEYETIRKALHAAVRRSESDAAHHLAIGLHRYWLHRCLYQEARADIRPVLELPVSQDSFLNARLWNISGVIAWFECRWDDAEKEVGRALSIWEQIGAHDRASGAIINLGLISLRQGNQQLAKQRLAEGLEQAEKHGNKPNALLAIQNLATMERDEEDFAAAARLYERAIEQSGQNFDEGSGENVLGNLASCYVMMGQPEDAVPLFIKALQMSQKKGNLDRLNALFWMLSWFALQTEQAALAKRFLQAAGKIEREVSLPNTAGFEQRLRDLVNRAMGEIHPAESSLQSDPVSLDAVVGDAIRWLQFPEESNAGNRLA